MITSLSELAHLLIRLIKRLRTPVFPNSLCPVNRQEQFNQSSMQVGHGSAQASSVAPYY